MPRLRSPLLDAVATALCRRVQRANFKQMRLDSARRLQPIRRRSNYAGREFLITRKTGTPSNINIHTDGSGTAATDTVSSITSALAFPEPTSVNCNVVDVASAVKLKL